MKRWLPALLLGAVAAQRLLELRVSRRHERALRAAGAREAGPATYRVMVVLHSGMLAGAFVESQLRPRRPCLACALPWAVLLAGATGLRIWALRTLGRRWTVLALAGEGHSLTQEGPYRYIRHPNYLAVILEMAAVPLLAGAPVTALLASIANGLVLWRRIGEEEALLEDQAGYRERFARTARLIPGLF